MRGLLGGWAIHSRTRRRAIPMILPLGEETSVSRLTTPDEAFLPFQDQF